jgi:hypothetical protein
MPPDALAHSRRWGGGDTGLKLARRADIIWRKNGQPESVTDRVCGEHEFIFHFTSRARYYSACDEIREPLAAPGRKGGRGAFSARNISHPRAATGAYDGQNPLGRIPGSVWDIPTEPLIIPDTVAHARCCGGERRPGCENGVRHYAVWPTRLVKRIILGWSPPGICTACRQGRRPVAVRTPMKWRESPTIAGRRDGHSRRPASGTMLAPAETRITGYACKCPQPDAPVRPAVILDPFGGVGSTALVASVLGRTGITVDLGADYCGLAQWRTSDPAERARVLGLPKPPPVLEGHPELFGPEDWLASPEVGA